MKIQIYQPLYNPSLRHLWPTTKLLDPAKLWLNKPLPARVSQRANELPRLHLSPLLYLGIPLPPRQGRSCCYLSSAHRLVHAHVRLQFARRDRSSARHSSTVTRHHRGVVQPSIVHRIPPRWNRERTFIRANWAIQALITCASSCPVACKKFVDRSLYLSCIGI